MVFIQLTLIMTINPSAAVATFLLQISENSIFHLLALNGILSDST